ncbi:hypothetical protein DCC39_03285 [Pueribacillus theae]|uniref:Class D sortase n=1 Tax=Pueribacillus theae TaxID=2171751 RepID=A0A2U1K5W5_9BACI|nr:hypothetical protein DCC39_03285 [Pueribacillus theae]
MYVSQLADTPNPEGGHTVLSGHRDTVFRKLGELENGDAFTVQYDDKEYRYSIKKIGIADPEDRTVTVEKDKPTLTLTTCYPF